MKKIVVFGNSGSGKSTLAKQLATEFELPSLDLDILAWQATQPPVRKPLDESSSLINAFVGKHQHWVVEGCYADLLSLIIDKADEVIFLNPGVETCIENCRARPWESHKYSSIEEQNNNLDMLLDWVKQYSSREDEFSLTSHQALFDGFEGNKTEYNSNFRHS